MKERRKHVKRKLMEGMRIASKERQESIHIALEERQELIRLKKKILK
jgi:hypothetical protein